jgi:hypothetical protein
MSDHRWDARLTGLAISYNKHPVGKNHGIRWLNDRE